MAEKKVPMRKCVACGEMIGKKIALRVVRTPSGEIVLDKTGKMNGRGAYLCGKTDCFAAARKGKKLERSLKTSISEDIYESIQKELEKDE